MEQNLHSLGAMRPFLFTLLVLVCSVFVSKASFACKDLSTLAEVSAYPEISRALLEPLSYRKYLVSEDRPIDPSGVLIYDVGKVRLAPSFTDIRRKALNSVQQQFAEKAKGLVRNAGNTQVISFYRSASKASVDENETIRSYVGRLAKAAQDTQQMQETEARQTALTTLARSRPDIIPMYLAELYADNPREFQDMRRRLYESSEGGPLSHANLKELGEKTFARSILFTLGVLFFYEVFIDDFFIGSDVDDLERDIYGIESDVDDLERDVRRIKRELK